MGQFAGEGVLGMACDDGCWMDPGGDGCRRGQDGITGLVVSW